MMGKVPWLVILAWWMGISIALGNWAAYLVIVAFWLVFVPAPLWWATRGEKFLNFYERFIFERMVRIAVKKDVDIETVHEEYDFGEFGTYLRMVKRKC